MARADAYNLALDNYARILVLVTQAIAEQSANGQANQATVDAIVKGSSGTGIVRPKVTYTVDGENYNWNEYQQLIIAAQRELMQVAQLSAGPFLVRSRGSV